MFLPDDALQHRSELMPASAAHETVWHLCVREVHMGCAAKLGQLAVVTLEAPVIPDNPPAGMFLMRLHPLRRDVASLPDGNCGVWLPAAVSFPHATVWQAAPVHP